MSWTPSSWRDRPAAQLPTYSDLAALGQIEARLASSRPLTRIADIRKLGAQLAEVAAGRAFLLQGGDCAESFAEFGADRVRVTFNLLVQLSAMLHASAACPIVTVARMAGQFAKPRSALVETIDGVTLPTYRGDIINSATFDEASRSPDPDRMLQAYRQSKVTIDLIRAFSDAVYADLSEIHRSARAKIGLGTEHGSLPNDRPAQIFTSHEALLLHYEQPLTRFDEESEKWWATSAHMIWIGDRTRSLDGAHVEYARGVANPVGLKCGPSMNPDELLRLIDRLDPENLPGRLVLIGRFGSIGAGKSLAPLMRATRTAGCEAIWSIDPMHGNTISAGGYKTRRIADISSEIATFFEVAAAEGVHAGGVHLEMTGADVTECIGGSVAMSECDLPSRYLTHCDPRLNWSQSLDVAARVAACLRDDPCLASDAA